MQHKNFKRLSYCVISALFLSACGSNTIKATPGSVPQGCAATASAADTLASMVWRLHSVKDASGVTSTRLKAGDPANRYSVTIKNGDLGLNGGCNIMGGSVTLGPNNRFSVGPMFSTYRACPGTLMQSDSEVSNYIAKMSRYAVNQHTLVLSAPDGWALTFTGTPTDETKYGAKGVRKFIELQSTKQGIRWREVKYDSQWIRIKDNAPWQSNFPGIQGFTPMMNTHYIVRLHEYVDPKTRQKVWVKDMVTMSGNLN
ncbi:MAG: hypothetical protein CSB47_11355 [Proteobacteria bacterium]|nr:MAG: hypothetical protein CSB47_11355 [Pseudomonadota bacterium]